MSAKSGLRQLSANMDTATKLIKRPAILARGFKESEKVHNMERYATKRAVYEDPQTGITHVTSDLRTWKGIWRPMPLNVEILQYAPFKLKSNRKQRTCDLELRSYSVEGLEMFADFAVRAAFWVGLPASGPVMLPRKEELWTIPKGAFVHTKTKINYERVTHKRMIVIWDSDSMMVDKWLGFLRQHEYAGVSLRAKMYNYESLEDFDLEKEVSRLKKGGDLEKRKPRSF
ncbi:mitochondrial 37S ribosomal protein uS10m [Lipomyces oligophaga]|uniref:mitochondrial 37S ribosomal protein uS10m n=1 Tax=Lipomyces oligophaga TaxID=45792 RepID=UPI0034CDC3BF